MAKLKIRDINTINNAKKWLKEKGVERARRRKNSIIEATNKELRRHNYSEINGEAEIMLTISASLKAHQDIKLRTIFATLGAVPLIFAWIRSGGGFNLAYAALFVLLALITNFYSYFREVEMGSRDAASTILSTRSATLDHTNSTH